MNEKTSSQTRKKINLTDPDVLERAFRDELAALRKQSLFADVSDAELEQLAELFRKLVSDQPPDVDMLLEWFEKEPLKA